MRGRHFLGVKRDPQGRIAPVFAEPHRTLDALGHHRAVIDALRSGPFVPAPFAGVEMRDPGGLAKRLRAASQRLFCELDRSGDVVELGVVINIDAVEKQQGSTTATGRAFLHKAASRTAAVELAHQRARDLLASIAAIPGVDEHRLTQETASIIKAAFAVTRAVAPEVARLLESAVIPGVEIEVSGPWPLYSFGLYGLLEAEVAA